MTAWNWEKSRKARRAPIRWLLLVLGCGVLVLTSLIGWRPPREAERVAGGTQTAAAVQPTASDADADGLEDAREDQLAELLAPIVFHGENETAFPTTVEAWLARTHLSTVDTSGSTVRVESGPLHQAVLLGQIASTSGMPVSSSGTRSRGKHLSFFLENVPAEDRSRSPDPSAWVTYVHSYPNEAGGITLQYWRAYTRNDATLLGIDVGHGGDWEAIAVHLDAAQRVRRTTYLDHSRIVDVSASARWTGTHPLVWSEEGGHSSYDGPARLRSQRWYRQETWTGGTVTRWDGVRLGTSGGLRNVGEKTHPRNGQVFIQYSGLWGARRRLFMTSGYWGPAFNETDASCADGSAAYRSYIRRADNATCAPILLRAWCDGIDGSRLDVRAECHAAADVP